MKKIQQNARSRSATCLKLILCFGAICWSRGDAIADLIVPDSVTSVYRQGPAAHVGTKLKPFAAALASASTIQNDPGEEATATVQYFLGVDGRLGAIVPIRFNTNGNYLIAGEVDTGPGVYRTQYSVDIGAVLYGENVFGSGNTRPLAEYYTSSDSTNPHAYTFHNDITVNLQSDAIYEVDVSALVGITDRFHAGVIGNAYIDPIISFAPGFDSTGFTLVFSPGVGNGPLSTSTPEPSTLVMWSSLLAIFGVVWACKRLKRTAPA